jgi:hypothetical protein
MDEQFSEVHCEAADVVAVFWLVALPVAAQVGDDYAVLIGEVWDVLLPDLRGACEAVDLGVLD